MQSRLIVNLILLVLFIGLVLLSLKPSLFKDTHAPDAQTQLATALTSLAAKDVTTIVVTNHTGSTRVAKQDGTWQVTEPVAVAANQYNMNELLNVAGLGSRAHYPADPAKLAQYGLDKPIATLKLNEAVIQFGATDPIQQSRYVLTSNTIHLIDDQYSYVLLRAPGSLIDTSLVLGQTDMVEISLPTFNLTKQAGHWQLTASADKELPKILSQDDLVRYVDEWRYAQALNVQVIPASVRKQAQDSARITFRFASKRQLVLLVARETGDTALTNPELGIRYHITRGKLEQLLSLPTPGAKNTMDTTLEDASLENATPENTAPSSQVSTETN